MLELYGMPDDKVYYGEEVSEPIDIATPEEIDIDSLPHPVYDAPGGCILPTD